MNRLPARLYLKHLQYWTINSQHPIQWWEKIIFNHKICYNWTLILKSTFLLHSLANCKATFSNPLMWLCNFKIWHSHLTQHVFTLALESFLEGYIIMHKDWQQHTKKNLFQRATTFQKVSVYKQAFKQQSTQHKPFQNVKMHKILNVCLEAFIVTKFNKICFSWQPEILFKFKNFVIPCPSHKFSYSMTIISSFLRNWIHDSDNSLTSMLLCNPLDWLHKLKHV